MSIYKFVFITLLSFLYLRSNDAFACFNTPSFSNPLFDDSVWMTLVSLLSLNFITLIVRHFKNNRSLLILNICFLFIILMPHIFINLDNTLFPEDMISVSFDDGKRALEMSLEDEPIHTDYMALQYITGVLVFLTGFFKSIRYFVLKIKKLPQTESFLINLYYISIGIVFILIPLLMGEPSFLNC